MPRIFAFALLLASSWGVVACGNDSGGPVTVGSTDAGCSIEPTFTSIYQKTLSTSGCVSSGCHNSSAAGGLDLSLDQAAVYRALLESPTADTGAQATVPKRVVPRDPMASFLYRKLRDETPPGVGVRMPLGCSFIPSVCLSDCALTALQAWIEQGAEND